ncbi:hypothetical protein FHR99_000610 [Litorivivens lipolytica]|uniref:Flagellar protein FlaG n=2 Tax=Litorivivens lipolytica TaxID=1524264 RepID=A0A7W4W2V0_9GAMM|nr:hypothetical protein [Litorivivens lipolytica]
MDINVNKSQGVATADAATRSSPNPDSGKTLPVLPVSKGNSGQAAVVLEGGKSASPPPELKMSSETVERLNKVLQERARELEFSVDEDSGHIVVRVIHKESGEVIRQLPPEVVLRFADAFTKGTGSLVEEFA